MIRSLVLAVTFALAVPAFASVSQKAEKLQDLYRSGRHDSYAVRGGKALDLVKQYIAVKYKDDADSVKAYRYVANARGFATDTQEAGTVSVSVVQKEIQSNEGLTERQKQYASDLVKEISEEGGSFGYDGFEQNGCAAPTVFLLVIDSAEKKVFGVDLTPCQE